MAMAEADSGRPESESCRDNDETELISLSWNQDYSCFAAGTSDGFHVYTCDPLKEDFKREFKGGGFGIVEMLFRCKIVGLVGVKGNLLYPPNKVFIWDDDQGRIFVEYSYRSEVRAVKLRQDFVVVVLEHKIYVHKFRSMKLLHQIETWANPKGLCSLSHHATKSVLASPGLRRGQVRVEHFSQKLTKLIHAHDSDLSCLTLALDGLLLATASTRGTLIRIFNTLDGTQLQEVRRGVDKAGIYGIALSPNAQWLAVSSDKGTVHVFSLRVGVVKEDPSTDPAAANDQNSPISPCIPTINNPVSSLSFIKGVLPKYFSSEWSFAQFHLPGSTQFIAAFGSQNTVSIAGMDGRFGFDPVNGGQMVQQEFFHFLKPEIKPR